MNSKFNGSLQLQRTSSKYDFVIISLLAFGDSNSSILGQESCKTK